ncbi:hypothetical protein [Mesoterricola sediminis]|uniref:Outer membrane protein beta-barrel domain-containing protein n=1 Tax=Mesoterricola sediminis TaxID=2927980 RepID=A0AA48H2Z5_9BACT|nr:hypothetical protein [Mesoterricola sediminis]BDU76531.1 hypothetical protein METESE_14890 [Mesoterricola sediminis]
MKDRLTAFRALTVLAAAFAPLLAAEPDMSFDLKLKTGLKGGSARQELKDNKIFGFALGASRAYGSGRLTAELGFDILPGQNYDATPFSGAIHAPAGTGLGIADPATGHPYFLRPNESLDLRKESAQGFSLKLGYAAPLSWNQGLSWHAGISLEAYKVSSEFTGTLRPMYVNASGTPTQVATSLGKYYEGFAFVSSGTSFAPGAFAGLRQEIGEDFAVELNLRSFGLKHQDYRPTTYTGAAPVLETSTKRGFSFDVALCLKL